MLQLEQEAQLRQLQLVSGLSNSEEAFKKLYYFLYSNGSSSKASTILNDIVKVMLAMLATQKKGLNLDEIEKADIGTINNDNYDFFRLYGIVSGPSGDNKTIRSIVEILGQIDLTSISSHELGSLYQALIGPRARGEKGQFFTQRNLCRALVELCDVKDGERVLDPACGTGGFLAETVAHLDMKNIKAEVIGYEKDQDIFLIAQLAQNLVGNNFTTNLMDSLDDYQKEDSPLQKESFDVIVTNPPFGSKIKVLENNILKKYLFSREWIEYEKGFLPSNNIRPTDPQILFFELCLNLLREGGRLAIVLPEGIFGNKASRFIWEYLKEDFKIDYLIDNPRSTFQPGTDTKTNCLVATKISNKKANSTNTRVFVAQYCGHNKRGKSTDSYGKPLPDDFKQIANLGSQHPGWQEVLQLKPDYFVPRYYYSAKSLPIQEGFSEYTFGELLTNKWITVHKGVEVGSDAYGTGPIPYIRTSDISNLDCSADPSFSISYEIFERIPANNKPCENDILLVVDGRYRIGANAIISQDSMPIAIQSHIKIIRTTKISPLNNLDLILALNSDFSKEEFKRITFIQSTIGTVVPLLGELKLRFGIGSEEWEKSKTLLSEALQARAIYKSTVTRVLGRQLEQNLTNPDSVTA